MANDLNSVILIGNIVRDLGEGDFGYAGSCARATISIASNRSKKQADGSYDKDVSYFDINIWGKTAENLKPYLKKGKQVCIEGVLKQDRWEKDGKKFSKIVINAVNVQLLGGGSKDASPSASSGPATSQQSFNPADGFDEDFPF